MIQASSGSSAFRQLAGRSSYSNSETQPGPNEYSESHHGMYREFERSEDFEEQTATSFTSILEVTYAEGESSSIDQIKFFDARTINDNNWKVIYPISRNNQQYRVAAVLSILSGEAVDGHGNHLTSDSEICQKLLGRVEKANAISSSGSLSTTYGRDAEIKQYLQTGRQKLKIWYDRNGNKMSSEKKVKKSRSRNGFLFWWPIANLLKDVAVASIAKSKYTTHFNSTNV
jgi:hypothetical protein